jgi:hypothetical protein
MIGAIKMTKTAKRQALRRKYIVESQVLMGKANEAKCNLAMVRRSLRENDLKGQKLEAAVKLEVIFKDEAIKYYNQSQSKLLRLKFI